MKKTTVNRFDAKFPKARPGDLCDGVEITSVNGERIGCLRRDFEFTNVARTGAGSSYTRKVVGYTVERYDGTRDMTFGTLAAARAFAREMGS